MRVVLATPGAHSKATPKRLKNSSLGATTGTLYGGQTFENPPDGNPLGALKTEALETQEGVLSFELAAASAVLMPLSE